MADKEVEDYFKELEERKAKYFKYWKMMEGINSDSLKDRILRKIFHLVKLGEEIKCKKTNIKGVGFVTEYSIGEIQVTRTTTSKDKYYQGENLVFIREKSLLDDWEDRAEVYDRLDSLYYEQNKGFEERRDKFIEDYLNVQ